MYAIIKTGGKQYSVKPGDIIEVEHTDIGPNQELKFDRILAINEAENTEFGTPFIEGAYVNAELIEHRKGKKVLAFKMKRRKRYRRKIGHRQLRSRFKILDIKRNHSEMEHEKSEEMAETLDA